MTTPSARSTVPSSKATAPTSKDKGLADHTATSLTSNNIAKSAASVATLIQKTAPGTSSVSDTPMEVEVSKAPTTAASTLAKSTSGLISPTKSVQSKSPMSVAVEVPKVKLSGAAIAAAMVTTAKTTTTTESNTTATSASSSASAASSSGEGESVDGDIGVKTRQKQVHENFNKHLFSTIHSVWVQCVCVCEVYTHTGCMVQSHIGSAFSALLRLPLL